MSSEHDEILMKEAALQLFKEERYRESVSHYQSQADHYLTFGKALYEWARQFAEILEHYEQDYDKYQEEIKALDLESVDLQSPSDDNIVRPKELRSLARDVLKVSHSMASALKNVPEEQEKQVKSIIFNSKVYLGLCQLDEGDVEDAISTLEGALGLLSDAFDSPDALQAMFFLYHAYATHDDMEQAISLLRGLHNHYTERLHAVRLDTRRSITGAITRRASSIAEEERIVESLRAVEQELHETDPDFKHYEVRTEYLPPRSAPRRIVGVKRAPEEEEEADEDYVPEESPVDESPVEDEDATIHEDEDATIHEDEDATIHEDEDATIHEDEDATIHEDEDATIHEDEDATIHEEDATIHEEEEEDPDFIPADIEDEERTPAHRPMADEEGGEVEDVPDTASPMSANPLSSSALFLDETEDAPTPSRPAKRVRHEAPDFEFPE